MCISMSYYCFCWYCELDGGKNGRRVDVRSSHPTLEISFAVPGVTRTLDCIPFWLRNILEDEPSQFCGIFVCCGKEQLELRIWASVWHSLCV